MQLSQYRICRYINAILNNIYIINFNFHIVGVLDFGDGLVDTFPKIIQYSI